MRFPSSEQVDKASGPQLWEWHNKLPTPKTEEEQEILELIELRLLHTVGVVPPRFVYK